MSHYNRGSSNMGAYSKKSKKTKAGAKDLEPEGEDFPIHPEDTIDVSKKFIAETRSDRYEEIANLKSKIGIRSPSSVVNPASLDLSDISNKFKNMKTMSPGTVHSKNTYVGMTKRQVETSVRKDFVNLFRQPVLDNSLLKTPSKLPNVRVDSSGLALDNALL